MAVAVEHAPFLTLDADDRIVGVSPAAEAVYGSLIGRTLWDRYPEAAPLFAPHYARARRTQAPVDFVQFFKGEIARIRVVPHGPRITVSWEMLFALDTLTLDRLQQSIAEALELLERSNDHERRARLRDLLRVVEGGGGDGPGTC